MKDNLMLKTLWKPTLRLWAFTFFNVPLLAWLRPRVMQQSENGCVIMMPYNRRTKNHLPSMYFGALCAGAELAPGLLALEAINHSKAKVSFIFKDFQAEFLKRCEADAYFTCEQGGMITKAVQAAITTGERQNVTLNVVGTTPTVTGNEAVARFQLTISIKSASQKTPA
jgi:hypothetical protein